MSKKLLGAYQNGHAKGKAMATAKTPKSKKSVTEVVTEVVQAQPEDEKTKKVKAVYKERAISESAGLTVDKVTQNRPFYFWLDNFTRWCTIQR
jgi:hypothetical protein